MIRPKPLVIVMFDHLGVYMSAVSMCFLLRLGEAAQSQIPPDFHWLNLKRENSTVSRIADALNAEHYTKIQTIGVMGEFALVFAVKRATGEPTADADGWRVYSVSMKTREFKILLDGYHLQIKDWMNFEPASKPDLGVAYMDCWGCEPGSLFTAIHYEPRRGWRARWPNDKDIRHPGIVFLITDAGEPYTSEDVDQVFAAFAPIKGNASAGTWYRSRDLKTGKVAETVLRFYVDPLVGDKSIELVGSEATRWKLRLCEARDAVMAVGQDSGPCKRILSTDHKSSK